MRIRPVREAGDPGPLVVVERIAADVDHAVDRGRAAERLAPRAVHAPAVHARLRLGDVGPVPGGAVLRIRERGRHPDAPLPPRHRPTGLDEKHAHVRVLGEPAREYAPRGAGPDDNVVVAGCSHDLVPPIRRNLHSRELTGSSAPRVRDRRPDREPAAGSDRSRLEIRAAPPPPKPTRTDQDRPPRR